MRELAQTAHHGGGTKQTGVGPILLTIERLATAGAGYHSNLVLLEIGLLEDDTGAIAQLKFLVVKLAVVALLFDFTLLGQLADEGLLLHIVHKGLHLGVQTGVNSSLQAFGGGINGTVLLLVEVHYNKVCTVGGDVAGHHLVDDVNGNLRNNHVHDLVFLLNRGHGLVVEIVAVVLAGKTCIRNLVAFVVLPLELAHVLFLGTLILGCGKAVLGGTHSLGHYCLGSSFGHALLGQYRQREGINRVGQQIATVIAISLNEGAVGLLGLLPQAVVEHAAHHVGSIVHDHINHVALHLLGEGFMLEHHLNLAVLLLLVLVYNDDGSLVVGNGLVNNLCSIWIQGHAFEQVLDLGLDVVNIHITNDYQGLVVGTIPLVVVVAQLVVLEVVNHFHQTDGHAATILRAGI